jgi:subtilisin family serine protease
MRNPGSLRIIGFAVVLVAIGVLGWQVGTKASRESRPRALEKPGPVVPLRRIVPPAPLAMKSGRDLEVSGFDTEALDNEALPGERVLRFRNSEALRRFLASLDGTGLRVLGTIASLNAVRIGFDDISALENLPDDTAEQGFVYPVYVPKPPSAEAQPDAIALGRGLLESLGVSGDVSGFGKGVKIAILDTGVEEHPAIQTSVTRTELVPLPEDPAQQNGHGTAVASLIAGSHELVPGVAPAAELLSIRVADDQGVSNSFTLAEGIMKAIEDGAQIINISMGSYGDSPILHDAVKEATDAGIVIVAAAGNDAMSSLAYPAAYPEVLGVGAVDAAGTHLDFSNTDETLAASAPGFGVNAAWPGDALISFSGTSASTPILAGTIAATMSQNDGPALTAQQAADAVLGNLDEAGQPGADPLYGGGLVDLGRTLRRDQPGVMDAAVASNVLVPSDSPGLNPELLVTVENRGTELMVNSTVNVFTRFGARQLNITTLPPGETKTFKIQLPTAALDPENPLRVQTSVSPGNGQVDQFPANNRRADVFEPESAP